MMLPRFRSPKISLSKTTFEVKFEFSSYFNLLTQVNTKNCQNNYPNHLKLWQHSLLPSATAHLFLSFESKQHTTHLI